MVFHQIRQHPGYNIQRKMSGKNHKTTHIDNNNKNDNIIPEHGSQHSNKSNSHRSHSQSHRSNNNKTSKRGSSHGSHHSQHSHHSHHSHHSSHHSHRSKHSQSHSHSRKSNKSGKSGSQKKMVLSSSPGDNDDKGSQFDILSRSISRKSLSKHSRRLSDSETTLLRRFTNDTTASHRYQRPHHQAQAQPLQSKIPYYQYSNTTVQSKRGDTNNSMNHTTPLDLKYGVFSNSTLNSRSSGHSRSSSDFIGIGSIDKLGGNKYQFSQFRKQKSNPNSRYDYGFGPGGSSIGGSIDYQEDSVMSMSSNGHPNMLSAGDNSPSNSTGNSTITSMVRQYKRKGGDNQILKSFASPPRSQRIYIRLKKRTFTSKCDQIHRIMWFVQIMLINAKL